ncbi:MAG: beta-ketoacyl-[acyl-carrier-protein] synthase family protein, partial [Prevotellaceae bacterium]|nr:beta-ketoacyl-[acyl-carrier-protein] synthase family protein [Prevotellaceae bacterium]
MIVITGAGLLSAIGTNQAETLQSLRDARAGLHPVRFLPTVH